MSRENTPNSGNDFKNTLKIKWGFGLLLSSACLFAFNAVFLILFFSNDHTMTWYTILMIYYVVIGIVGLVFSSKKTTVAGIIVVAGYSAGLIIEFVVIGLWAIFWIIGNAYGVGLIAPFSCGFIAGFLFLPEIQKK